MGIIYRPRKVAGMPGDAEASEPVPITPIGLVLALIGAGGIAASITVLYRGMETIMETSGAFVASGGPYEIASPAPDWVWVVPVAVWTMLIFGGLALYGTKKGWGESPLLYGWMGLFLSLGWNFLRLGFDPPEFMESTWGWIVPGVLFWIMALVPAGFVVSWAIDAFKDARAHRPPSTISGRPTRGIYLAMQVVGVAAGIAAANVLFAVLTAA